MKVHGLTKICFCLLFYISELASQNETSQWYFGVNAGLDFTTNPPNILTNGVLYTNEGSSSFSDNAGNIMFYTDGSTVYNRQHAIMANGSNLFGNSSTTQSAIVLKQPGSQNLFYVFSMGAGIGSLWFSIIDMNLASGNGSVTIKNSLVFNGTTEQMMATSHSNGIDFWIVIHEAYTNVFKSYLLNASGLSAAVNSAAGTTHIGFSGQLKISPNGDKLGIAVNLLMAIPGNGNFEVYDFNNLNGVVSNPLILGSNFTNPYGVEFSPDGSKFYGANALLPSQVYQWNLCAGSNSAIVNSSVYLGTGTGQHGQLQLANNGRIYLARFNSQLLGVIANPNVVGTGCNFNLNGQNIAPALCRYGLPSFAVNYIRSPFSYTVDGSISCFTASFTAPSPLRSNVTTCGSSCGTGSYSWNFGDPPSGTANNSSITTPVHIYPGPGTYTVKLVQSNFCGVDTIVQVLTLPNFNLQANNNQTVCAGLSTTLTASGASSYTWNGTAGNASFVVTPITTGIYTVNGTDPSGNCVATRTINLTVINPSPISVSGNTTICFGNLSTLFASGANTYTWNSVNTGSTITVSPSVTTTYSVTGTASLGACVASAAVVVAVHALPILNTFGNMTLCQGQSVTLTAMGANAYTWIPGGNTNPSFTLTPPTTRTYTVTGSNVYGCVSSTNVVVTVSKCLDIEELYYGSPYVFPNPANTSISVILPVKAEVCIIDIYGKKVLQNSYEAGLRTINIECLESGNYFLQWTQVDGIKHVPFVKCRN